MPVKKAMPVLGDPLIFPDDTVLASHLGRSMAAYRALLEWMKTTYPEALGGWKYYRDGKSWLFNASRKKKTLFWLSAGDGWFRTTCYFSMRHRDFLLGKGLPEAQLGQLAEAEAGGKKNCGLTVVVGAKADLAALKGLIELKVELG